MGETGHDLPVLLRILVASVGVVGLGAAGFVVFCLVYLHVVPEILRFRWRARHGTMAGYRTHRAAADSQAALAAGTAAGRRIIGLRSGSW